MCVFFCCFMFLAIYVRLLNVNCFEVGKRIKTILPQFLSFQRNIQKIKHRFEGTKFRPTFAWHSFSPSRSASIFLLASTSTLPCEIAFVCADVCSHLHFMCLLNWDNNEAADSNVMNFSKMPTEWKEATGGKTTRPNHRHQQINGRLLVVKAKHRIFPCL